MPYTPLSVPWQEPSAASSSNTLHGSISARSMATAAPPSPQRLQQQQQQQQQPSSYLTSQQRTDSLPPLDFLPQIRMSESNDDQPSRQYTAGAGTGAGTGGAATSGGQLYPMPPPPSAPSSVYTSPSSHHSTPNVTSNAEPRPYTLDFELPSQASSSFSSSMSPSAGLRPPSIPLNTNNRPDSDDGDKESLSSLSALRLERLDSYATINLANQTVDNNTHHNNNNININNMNNTTQNDKGKGRASSITLAAADADGRPQLLLSPPTPDIPNEQTPLGPNSPPPVPPKDNPTTTTTTTTTTSKSRRHRRSDLSWRAPAPLLKLFPALRWCGARPLRKSKRTTPASKASSSPPPPVFTYSNGELKSMFSNERIFLEWIKVAILLGTLSMTLLSFGNSQRSATPWIGLALIMCTLITIIYSTTQFHIRMEWMLKQRDEEEGAHFYDRLAPTVITVLLVGIMAFNAYVVVSGQNSTHQKYLKEKN
ncbi:vacuolar transporter chaperone [Actinomortierella ambigua]|nr:vacuolar transporter chaperone [Actinomortierella ambigua]